MKKIIAIILIVVSMLLIFCSCNMYDAEDVVEDGTRFEMISNEYCHGYIVVVLRDVKTGVMYLYSRKGYSGGITVMYDENGSVLVQK